MEAGEIAATGGTSGVVYGVTDKRQADPQSRVNTFVHVNHTASNPRYGILLCINGTGIMNSWIRRNVTQETIDYAEMNRLAASVPAGSEGVLVVPFGNGAERDARNRCPGAGIVSIDLNRHTTAHILRAAQEGIAYSFRYGIDIMRGAGGLAPTSSAPDRPTCSSRRCSSRRWRRSPEPASNCSTPTVRWAQHAVRRWEPGFTRRAKAGFRLAPQAGGRGTRRSR